ncbi:MAG: hypothetical protein IJN63_11225 [Clostridia bacterium]|nr:hypothetical protein [Clostridia bacterium]
MDRKAVKRVTVFAGHYGSGKTNIAVNYALEQKEHFDRVAIADLDIVNPYFRSKDATDVLNEKGVRLISSPFANTNVDTPALPAEAYALVHDRECRAVIDVGGDDRGALALGRYAPDIKAEDDYEALLVINMYRPLTANARDCAEIMHEIENSASIPFTGIVNNSNLGSATTAEDVLESIEYANEVSRLTGLPVKYTCVREGLYEALKDRIENLKPIRLYVRQSFDRRRNEDA